MNRHFLYYRAGVVYAKVRLEAESCFIRLLNPENMTFGAEQPYTGMQAPLDPDIDRRFDDAIRTVIAGVIPEGYNLAEEGCHVVCGKQMTIQRHIEKLDKYPLDLVLADGQIIASYDNERHYLGILVEEGFEALTPLANLEKGPISKAEYGFSFMGTEMVEMRDGIHLATDVYLPTPRKPGQKFPTVLIRTCYNKFSAAYFFSFAHYGYAIVSQDTRGRELSEGEWQPIINERDDGDDTLNWIAQQEWSDGSVGMIGPSYLSIVQWQVAASGNKHLKAMISMVTGGVPMFDFPHRAGVLSPGTMAWTYSMRNRHFDPNSMERDDWDDLLKLRPVGQIPQKGLGEPIEHWDEWMKHEYYDGYWHKGNFLMEQHKIDYPVLYVTGWYDDVGPGSMQAWDMMKRNGRANQHLVCGAWKHKMNVSRDIHGNYYGADSVRYDMFWRYLRWYDHFLKGIENGVENEPPVLYFTIGENKWHEASQWPPAERADTELYLSSGGNAATSSGDGKASFEMSLTQGTDHFTYDPLDPAPFLIDVSENECLVPENYRDVECRKDVLVYTSEPLKEAVTIAGEPTAILYASSSARDTDWVVRLTDVDPEGNSIRMSDGIIRARFRKSFIEPKLLIPGEVVRYEIPMTWISNRFEVGHRIRVEITSGADNSVFPNSNTGAPIADDDQFVLAEQTIYSGGRLSSCIVLPVIPETGK